MSSLGTFCALLTCMGTLYSAPHEDQVAVLSSLIAQYKRPSTVLEINTQIGEYLSVLPTFPGSVGVAWILPGSLYEGLEHKKCTVLAPPVINCTMLETFGRCEHFDVVIVHNTASFIRDPLERLLAALVRLGDVLFIEPDTQEFEELLSKSPSMKICVNGTDQHRPLYCYQRSKRLLSKARYTQKSSSKIHSYRISSSFLKKEFSKDGSQKPISWIPGINFVSFIMLYGIYPTDVQIRKQLKSLRATNEQHTDLVLGNLILSGESLIPIDGDDPQHTADSSQCIQAALKVFQKGNTRLTDPKAFMESYYRLVR